MPRPSRKNQLKQNIFPDSQNILDNAPIGIFTTTPDGRYLYVNNTLAQMHGYDSPHHLMDSITDIATQIYVNPADRDELKRLLEKHGKVTNFECQLRHKNGSYFWVSENVNVIEDEDGNTIGYQGFNQDITERKQSEEKYQDLVENINDVIFSIDMDDRITYLSPSANNILGAQASELLGRNFWELIDPRDIPQIKDSLKNVLQGRLQPNEFRLCLKPDKTMWVRTSSRPLVKDGTTVGITGVLTDISQNKRKDEELRRSQERFSLAMEASKDGLWDWDVTTGDIYCSPGLTSMLGYNSTDVITHVDNWQDLIHSEDRERACQANLDCAKNLTDSFKVEYRMKTRDGDWRWILGRGRAVSRDASGSALRMVGTHTDITEQKNSEKRIRHLNAVLQAYTLVNRIIFHARDMKLLLQEICQALISTRGYYNAWIILLDSDRNVSDWGQAGIDDEFPELLARFQDGNIPQNSRTILSSDLLQVVVDPRNECRDCALSESYAGRASLSMRLEVEGSVLGLLTVSIPKNLARDSEEHELFTNLAGTIAQGIQRISLEEIRRAQRERLNNYERIISRIEDGMCLVGPDYRYIVVNDAYIRKYGKSRQEIEGSTVGDLVGNDVFKNKIKHHLDTALKGQEVAYEITLPDMDNSLRHISMNYYPFNDQGGRVSGVVVAARDVTERKQAEEKIKAINEQLQQANADKDNLFTIIAHDLKSPLSGVHSSLQILAKEAESLPRDDIRFISAEMHKNSQNVLALLHDLMQWARMNQKGMDFSPEGCSLYEIARASLYTARDVAGKKDITIQDDIPKNLIVHADQPMINTVIRNMIFNAVKFTRPGGHISISARQADPFVQVCVQDDGIGMDEVIMSKIFSVDKNKRQYGTGGEQGTGLGLILCKEFVEKHGGKVWVESEPDKGTKVFFTLPGESGGR